MRGGQGHTYSVMSTYLLLPRSATGAQAQPTRGSEAEPDLRSRSMPEDVRDARAKASVCLPVLRASPIFNNGQRSGSGRVGTSITATERIEVR